MWTLSYRVSIVMCDFVWVQFTESSSDYVAQAAHWYDYQKMWLETARILRKGGTAVFWVCPDLNLFVRLFTHNVLNFPMNIPSTSFFRENTATLQIMFETVEHVVDPRAVAKVGRMHIRLHHVIRYFGLCRPSYCV